VTDDNENKKTLCNVDGENRQLTQEEIDNGCKCKKSGKPMICPTECTITEEDLQTFKSCKIWFTI